MSASDYPIESMISDVSALSTEYEGNDDENEQIISRPPVQHVPHRLSLSENNLLSRTPESSQTMGRTYSQMSLRAQQNMVPIGATIRENQELMSQLQIGRAELQVAIYKEREARDLLSKDVRDILDEHYQMQLDSLETNKKLEQYDKLQASLHTLMNERDEALKSLNEYQKTTQNDILIYQKQIEELTKQLNSARSQASEGYHDFTLESSTADPEIVDLQQKLNHAMEENTELLSKNENLQEEVKQLRNSLEVQRHSAVDTTTFAIGNNEREKELLSKMDSMESDYKQKESAMLGVIQTLLQTESAMKKQLARIKNQEESHGSQSSDNIQDMDRTGSPSEIDDWLNRIRDVNLQMKTEYGLDLNASKAEEVEVGGAVHSNLPAPFSGSPQTSFIQEENVPHVNTSFADILQLSINASEDVRHVKIKFETVKDLLFSMFERLKGSAGVLDEVYKYLSNGSTDNRAIAEKIRKMKFELSAMTCKDSQVVKAVKDAEDSMFQLQSSLCVFEESLNQTTSFIMETSRRYSTVPSQHQEPQTYGTTSNDASHYQQVIHELQENLALSKINVDEMKALVNSTKAELVEVTDARDEARVLADSLRKKIDQHNVENNKTNKESNIELASELNTTKDSITTLTSKIQELTEESEELKQEIYSLQANLQHTKEDLEDAEYRLREQRQEMDEVKLSRSEVSQRFVATQEELDKTKALLDKKVEAFEELQHACNELVKEYGESEIEQKNLQDKCAELETAAARKERAVAAENRRLVEQATYSQETVTALDQALDGNESSDVRISRASNGVFSFSRIQMATQVNKQTTTELVGGSFEDTLNKTVTMSREVERLYAVYCKLATAIYASVTTYAPPSHMYKMEVHNVESVTKELVELLLEAQAKNKMAMEQLDKILEKQERRTEQVSSEDPGSAMEYKHRETRIDDLRYSTKLRQDFYWLTALSADLTYNLKNVEKVLRPHNKVNFNRIVDDSRKIRNGLNERLALITKSDKENVVPQSKMELVDMNNVLHSQNEDLHGALRDNRANLEAFRNEVSKQNSAPDMLSKIQGELYKIEKVMSTASRGIRKVPRN